MILALDSFVCVDLLIDFHARVYFDQIDQR